MQDGAPKECGAESKGRDENVADPILHRRPLCAHVGHQVGFARLAEADVIPRDLTDTGIDPGAGILKNLV